MRPQKIEKGRKGIFHIPFPIKRKKVYKQRMAISYAMTRVTDECDSGWDKIWGIAFGLHHFHSSYRFVFRNKDNNFHIGYYSYINGVSPQTNKEQKGEFKTIIPIYHGDVIEMIIEELDNGKYQFTLKTEFDGNEYKSPEFDGPKYFKWYRSYLYPNLKCKQEKVITFPFLRQLTD